MKSIKLHLAAEASELIRHSLAWWTEHTCVTWEEKTLLSRMLVSNYVRFFNGDGAYTIGCGFDAGQGVKDISIGDDWEQVYSLRWATETLQRF